MATSFGTKETMIHPTAWKHRMESMVIEKAPGGRGTRASCCGLGGRSGCESGSKQRRTLRKGIRPRSLYGLPVEVHGLPNGFRSPAPSSRTDFTCTTSGFMGRLLTSQTAETLIKTGGPAASLANPGSLMRATQVKPSWAVACMTKPSQSFVEVYPPA